MTYEDIAKAIGGGTKPDAIRQQLTNKKQNRESMFMFGKIGKKNRVTLRGDGDASAPPRRPTFDHVLEVLKDNTGGMTYEDIAKAIGGGTKPDAIRKQVTNKKQNRKSMFMFGKIGKQNLVHLAHLAL